MRRPRNTSFIKPGLCEDYVSIVLQFGEFSDKEVQQSLGEPLINAHGVMGYIQRFLIASYYFLLP